MSSQRKGRWEGKASPIHFFNVHRCSTNKVKKGESSKMFLIWRFDVCALSETKLKGKGEVVGRVSGMVGGRAGNWWSGY